MSLYFGAYIWVHCHCFYLIILLTKSLYWVQEMSPLPLSCCLLMLTLVALFSI